MELGGGQGIRAVKGVGRWVAAWRAGDKGFQGGLFPDGTGEEGIRQAWRGWRLEGIRRSGVLMAGA